MGLAKNRLRGWLTAGMIQRESPLFIGEFQEEFRWLSNFWPAPVAFDHLIWPTTEHAYQAAKTLNLDERRLIALSDTAGRAKVNGQKLTIRPDWEQIKIDVMCDLIGQKFADNDLGSKLLATGSAELIEGNRWHDNFWGKCICDGCSTKEARNWLGWLLMERRKGLRDGS